MISVILESLHHSRQDMLLLESVDGTVTNEFKNFLSKAKLGAKDTKRVRDTLNDIFKAANSMGKNSMKYGKMTYTPGEWEDTGGPESGPHLEYTPSMTEFAFFIFFDIGNTVIEDIDTLLMKLNKEYKHRYYKEPWDTGYFLDFRPYESDANAAVYLQPNDKKGYIRVSVTAYGDSLNEGTDISGVVSPTGKVGEIHKLKEEKWICPECGSEDVNLHNDGKVFHCTACNHEWSVNDADDDKVHDDKETPEDIKKHRKKKIEAKKSETDEE